MITNRKLQYVQLSVNFWVIVCGYPHELCYTTQYHTDLLCVRV